MSEKVLTFKQHYPHTFDVDVDPETGETQSIKLLISRMTVEQAQAFTQGWNRRMSPDSARSIYRKSDGDEQQRVPRGKGDAFLVDDDEIRRRRVQEMTDEARTAFLALEETEDAEDTAFLVDTVTQYVRVAPGQRVLMEPDGGWEPFEVRTGEDLVKAFGGHKRQLRGLGLAVFCENIMTAAEKKVWRSLSASSPSSSAPVPAVAGPTPGATVAPVASAGSALTEGVTA